MKLPENITSEQVNHIKALAEFVRKKEIQAREVYFKLLDKQFELLDKREIEITEICFFEKLMLSFKIDEDDTNKITQGYFCICKTPLPFLFRTREEDKEPSHIEVLDLEKLYSNDEVFHKNHNFYQDKKEHPFYGLHFSRGMNEILNKPILSFENILQIENVWIDFNVEFSLIDYHKGMSIFGKLN
jgi:hypothetical protein